MRKAYQVSLISAAVSASMLPAPGAAATYVVNRSIANGTATGTITTDGTVGELSNSNITDFNISVTLGGFVSTISKANTGSYVSIVGGGLTATTNGLSYNFSGQSGAYALFSAGYTNYYCLQVNGCFDQAGAGEGILSYNLSTRTPQSGNIAFASSANAAVPEPATWVTMALGFGLVGGAIRERRRATVAA